MAAAGATVAQQDEEVVNWSATHVCKPARVYTPETRREAIDIVAMHAATKEPLRPCGSTLSPNGIGFCRDGEALLNMALCDRVLRVDTDRRLVRVEAGARVEQVLAALGDYGLTLENLASIADQQIGGFVQVGAHGTGATLPPVDDRCVEMTLATPARGVVTLTEGDDHFSLCRVGLGACGVLLDATLRCVPKHLLREKVEVLTRAEVKKRHVALLRDNRHMRLMWIPHVDAVVCVTNNPTFPSPLGDGQGFSPRAPQDERLEPLRVLLDEELKERGMEPVAADNFAELRDALLKLDPLSLSHVKKVNAAEAEFWRRSQGVHVADSSKKLNFECGGQQWVNECAFPAGTLADPSGADLQYMLDLLAIIEAEGIPAPAPIEQRWTSGSSSPMSPASGTSDTIHSWVGIIMYLSDDDAEQRRAITAAFDAYKRRCERQLWPRFGAVEHWAKIELPTDDTHANHVRARLANRFPTADFANVRRHFDPDAILSNHLLDAVLPRV